MFKSKSHHMKHYLYIRISTANFPYTFLIKRVAGPDAHKCAFDKFLFVLTDGESRDYTILMISEATSISLSFFILGSYNIFLILLLEEAPKGLA